MSVSETGLLLLSALRKSGSSSLLFDVPVDYFNKDEQKVFLWLRDHFREHKGFPTSKTIKRETGVSTVKTNENVNYYIDNSRKKALYYRLMDPYSELREAMGDKAPDRVIEVCKEILQISRELGRDQEGVITIRAALDEVEADYDIAHDTIGLRGITTGWPYVDKITGGHQNGDLNTLVGRPGRGKTYMILKQAYSAWLSGKAILLVSMEMTALQLARRLVGISSGINPNYIKTGRLSSIVKQRMDGSISVLRDGVPFNMVVGGFRKSVSAVRALAEELNPDIIFVDASYLLTPEKKRNRSESRRETVSDVIEELKMITTDLNRPILQTVQFNRLAVKPRRLREHERRNPIGHLSLERIGETDVVGQVSSIVTGIELGDPPHERDRRWMGFLKGREGEQGHWCVHYEFNPVNFDIVAREDQREVAPINLDHME